jgi:hypothetical protein
MVHDIGVCATKYHVTLTSVATKRDKLVVTALFVGVNCD